jgi:hypothetical protein
MKKTKVRTLDEALAILSVARQMFDDGMVSVDHHEEDGFLVYSTMRDVPAEFSRALSLTVDAARFANERLDGMTVDLDYLDRFVAIRTE